MRIDWSDPAIDDLVETREYIAKRSEESARKVIGRLLTSVDPLAAFPQMGRLVPEAGGTSEEILELLIDNYRVLYEVQKNRVLILGIAHVRQDLAGAETKPWER